MNKIFIIWWKTSSVMGKAVFDLWIDGKIQVLLKICIVVLIGAPFFKIFIDIVMKYQDEKRLKMVDLSAALVVACITSVYFS